MYEADIERAVDQWREMERKAAAWDELRRSVSESSEPIAPQVLALMDDIVHPAHIPSTS